MAHSGTCCAFEVMHSHVKHTALYLPEIFVPCNSNACNQALVDANETQTTTILRSLKNTERVFQNEEAAKAQEAERKHPGDIGVIKEFIAGSKYRVSFQETGNTQDSVWSCGQASLARVSHAPLSY